MKKRKPIRRRPSQRAPGPKEASPRAKPGWTGLRRSAWFVGAGLILLLGFFAFHKHRSEADSAPVRLEVTNNPGLLPGASNRDGAALNRQSEAQAADLNNEGQKLLDSGDPKGAVLIFRQAVALRPEEEAFHYKLGIALTETGDLTNAENEYRETLRLLPDSPDAHNNYGNLLMRLGRHAEAEQNLAEAVKEMPESAEFHNSLGALQQRRKETNEALASFRKAVECDGNFWEAHFNLGQAYLLRNEREKAIAELNEALKIKPGLEPVERALARAMRQKSSNMLPEAAAPK